MKRAARLLVLAGPALALACRVANPDHCLHRAEEPDAWCAEHHPEAPFCSPCAAHDERAGCVAVEPDPVDCPAYAPETGGGEGGARAE